MPSTSWNTEAPGGKGRWASSPKDGNPASASWPPSCSSSQPAIPCKTHQGMRRWEFNKQLQPYFLVPSFKYPCSLAWSWLCGSFFQRPWSRTGESKGIWSHTCLSQKPPWASISPCHYPLSKVQRAKWDMEVPKTTFQSSSPGWSCGGEGQWG